MEANGIMGQNKQMWQAGSLLLSAILCSEATMHLGIAQRSQTYDINTSTFTYTRMQASQFLKNKHTQCQG